MSIQSKEGIEARLNEARITGLKGRTKESLLKYIDTMNEIERMKDSCPEEEKSDWEKMIREAVSEYNALKSANPDVMIYADDLNTGSSSVLGSVVDGLAEVFDYGMMGIGRVASAIGSIPIVASATEKVKDALSTAGAVGTIAVGEVSNYIADYLDGEVPSNAVLVHEVASEPEIAKEESIEVKEENTTEPSAEKEERPSEEGEEQTEKKAGETVTDGKEGVEIEAKGETSITAKEEDTSVKEETKTVAKEEETSVKENTPIQEPVQETTESQA